jgi:hypothetical protein
MRALSDQDSWGRTGDARDHASQQSMVSRYYANREINDGLKESGEAEERRKKE